MSGKHPKTRALKGRKKSIFSRLRRGFGLWHIPDISRLATFFAASRMKKEFSNSFLNGPTKIVCPFIMFR
jgi:hypothetical protein